MHSVDSVLFYVFSFKLPSDTRLSIIRNKIPIAIVFYIEFLTFFLFCFIEKYIKIHLFVVLLRYINKYLNTEIYKYDYILYGYLFSAFFFSIIYYYRYTTTNHIYGYNSIIHDMLIVPYYNYLRYSINRKRESTKCNSSR